MKALITWITLPSVLMLRGMTFFYFWAWFVAPLAGCQPNYATSCGLALFFHWLSITINVKQPVDTIDERIVAILLSHVLPIIVLGVGAIIHCFV